VETIVLCSICRVSGALLNAIFGLDWYGIYSCVGVICADFMAINGSVRVDRRPVPTLQMLNMQWQDFVHLLLKDAMALPIAGTVSAFTPSFATVCPFLG
jgi:hypothetical protein